MGTLIFRISKSDHEKSEKDNPKNLENLENNSVYSSGIHSLQALLSNPPAQISNSNILGNHHRGTTYNNTLPSTSMNTINLKNIFPTNSLLFSAIPSNKYYLSQASGPMLPVNAVSVSNLNELEGNKVGINNQSTPKLHTDLNKKKTNPDEISTLEMHDERTSDNETTLTSRVQKKPKVIKFPIKLFEMLQKCEMNGDSSIISWLPNGMGFKVHNKNDLERILPKYFSHPIQRRSFFRQINIYGFKRVRDGEYFHKSFRRDHPELLDMIERIPVKGGVHATLS